MSGGARQRTRFLVGALLLVLLPGVARAIPPFARKYGMACTTCHSGGPGKLSIFGEAFRENGYQIPGGDEEYVREKPIPLGAPERARLFPHTIMPGQIPAWLPLGVGAELGIEGLIAHAANPSAVDYTADVQLYLGGSIGKHFTYFGVIEGGVKGIALDQVFMVFRSLFQRWLGENQLNIKVGYFEPDLFSVQPGRGRSAVSPLLTTLSVGAEGYSLGGQQPAIELYGVLGGRWKWMAGVANGNKPVSDVHSRRDFFGRISCKLGGSRLDYSGASQDESQTTVNLGVATYWGVGSIEGDATTPAYRNPFGRVLFDARLRSHGVDLIGTAGIGQDLNPDGSGERTRHLTWSASLEYQALPWLFPHARYEEAYFDTALRETVRRLVVGNVFFVRTNLRLRLEGSIALSPAEPHKLVADLFFAM